VAKVRVVPDTNLYLSVAVDWNPAPVAWLGGNRGVDAGDNASDHGRATRGAGASKIQTENQNSPDFSGGTYGIAVERG
jgi:hypothetical protein